jgi:hypothetical protein
MAVYTYSSEQIERMLDRNNRFRVTFTIVAVAMLIVVFLITPTKWDRHPALREWLPPVAIAILAVPLFNILRRWKSGPAKLEKNLRNIKIEISSAGVRLSSSIAPTRDLDRTEITRAEEPPWGGGLYLRTRNRYSWMVVPRTIDNYEPLKTELSNIGIPIERTATPPNWEEFIWVLLFIGTIVCSTVVHDVRFLTVNLAVSVLLAPSGLFIINSNPNIASRQRWMARFGIALPVLFSAIGLWQAVRP